MQSLPNFPGPLAIDGFVERQGVPGDWLPGPGGATNVVFNSSCQPLVPLAFHLTDLWNDQVNDDIFDGGNKLFQNPNDWGWRSQKPPAKDDINNSLVFLALNPANNHIWVAMTGDRMSTNGTSYLDFEFYQNSITKTGGPIPGGTGGFLYNIPGAVLSLPFFICNGNQEQKQALMIILRSILLRVLHSQLQMVALLLLTFLAVLLDQLNIKHYNL
jgi:hypothetical protein